MNSDKLDDQEKTKRIKILGREELSALYELPQFMEDEQKHFFSLSPEEKFNLKTFHALSSRIYFIVPFWEKNPALAARRFSIYNAVVCNTIEERPIQSLTAPITSFG